MPKIKDVTIEIGGHAFVDDGFKAPIRPRARPCPIYMSPAMYADLMMATMKSKLGMQYDDGGREAAGFKGRAGDCVVRALAIATGTDYRKVYDYCRNRMRSRYTISDETRERLSDAQLKRVKQRYTRWASPRTGVPSTVYEPWLKDRGFRKRKVKERMLLRDMPCEFGTVYVVRVRRNGHRNGHLVAVIDGTIHDTWNCSNAFVETIWSKA
jgi:hypothetical protein